MKRKIIFLLGVLSCASALVATSQYIVPVRAETSTMLMLNVEALARGEEGTGHPCLNIVSYEPDYGLPVYSVWYCGDCTIVPVTHWYSPSVCVE